MPQRPSHERELKSVLTGNDTNRDIADQVLAGINFFGNDFQLPRGTRQASTARRALRRPTSFYRTCICKAICETVFRNPRFESSSKAA